VRVTVDELEVKRCCAWSAGARPRSPMRQGLLSTVGVAQEKGRPSTTMWSGPAEFCSKIVILSDPDLSFAKEGSRRTCISAFSSQHFHPFRPLQRPLSLRVYSLRVFRP